MKLTGPEIYKRIKSKELVIEPFDLSQVNPNSYDLKLADTLLVYKAIPSVPKSPHMGGYFTRQVKKAAHVWKEEKFYNKSLSQYIRDHIPHIEQAGWRDTLDMKKDNPTYELIMPSEGLVLVPGRLYIGSTVEYTETPNLVPCIDGKSSIGRLGINVHVTAGFGDVGFKGTWTLEITVVEPVRIYPGVRFCQISYEEVVGEIKAYESKKYQGQQGPRASQSFRDT